MSEHYFTRIAGEISGPYSSVEVTNLVSNRRLGRMHQISTDRKTWQRAEEFPEFFFVVTPDVEDLVDRPKRPAMANPAIANEHPVASTAAPPPSEPAELQLAPEQVAANVVPTAPPVRPIASWYFQYGADQEGPVPAADITEMLAQRRLGPDDMVWREGMADWSPISACSEFAPPEPTPRPRRSRSGRHRLQPRFCDLALASLVISLIPLCGVNSPLAIIFGIKALSQISQSNGNLTGDWAAILGIVIGSLGMLLAIVLFANYLLLR